MKPLLHKPRSNNISILVFCVALLMISINTPTCLCDDDGQYTNCKAGFRCGSSSSISENLKYPFWGENRESYCGVSSNDHNMELECESDVPKITISEVKYRILNWVNTTQMLTVARDDYWDGDLCAADPHKNSTFSNTPFQRDDFANVTLLYGCDANAGNMLYSINCNGGTSTTVVYTTLDQASYSPNCTPTTIVVIPLLGAQVASTLGPGSGNGIINSVINKGFGLRYTGKDLAECGRCVGSGGVCGNDGGTRFRCFCKDTIYTTICNSEKASPSRMDHGSNPSSCRSNEYL